MVAAALLGLRPYAIHTVVKGQRPLAHDEKAYLVGLELPAKEMGGWTAAEALDELERLVDTAGGVVVGRTIQARAKPDRATYIGQGKAVEVGLAKEALDCDMVIFDGELSPVQQRNLEEILQCPVIDRTTVILDIFALRARTREAKLQVELAQLNYRLPRLTGTGTQLSRLGGGIGTRGPGETKLEVDRRRIRERVTALKQELQEIKAHRLRLRADRSRRELPVVALTGYTNAGKSTLHRHLSGSGVLAEDRLFATLDATTRQVVPVNGEPFLLVDTVGFIQDLPTFLVAAFRSTLEEVNEADVLLHVVDAAHPKREEQMQTVYDVLTELAASTKSMITVYNKSDLLAPGEVAHLLFQRPDSVAISALEGKGIDALHRTIQTVLARRRELVELVIPYALTTWVPWVHARGRVLAETHQPDGTFIKCELESSLASRLRAAVAKHTEEEPGR
jgi:GTP-binding protein HflX